MEKSILTPTQKYAAAALFALALHQSQIDQSRMRSALLSMDEEPIGEGASIGKSASVSDKPQLWIHENSGLLLSVFRWFGVDEKAWDGLLETAGTASQVRHHVGSFLKLLSEENGQCNSESRDKAMALSSTVEATAVGMDNTAISSEENERSKEFVTKCQQNFSISDQKQNIPENASESNQIAEKIHSEPSAEEKASNGYPIRSSEAALEEGKLLSYQLKVTVLFELLSACIAYHFEDSDKSSQIGKGYDARHRVALRLLSTWISIEWREMEAMEIMVAYSLMSSLKEECVKKEEENTTDWKRSGIISAAALTGGALMAVTGGLVAPAIAEGLSVLAPTLGSIIPAIGASGFAAAATFTGSAAGSIAVAASFGAAGAGLTGSKMARLMGKVDEFEFKEIGERHNQGKLAVGILVSGFVLDDEDFVRPWEGHNENLERYALCWESKHLIAVSNSVRDWLTSKIATGLMKQGAMLTVLSTLVTALALPASVMTASDIIDSTWAIAIDRSDKAGELLAEVLLKGLQGNRPVTLIGFSLGARVIFKCLQCLAEIEGDHGGLVERVVLLGAPVSIEDENWQDARKMVAGRFINVYSRNDWTLGIAFRASLLSKGLAGIQPVNVPGIENVDVTELIEGHSSYLWKTKQIVEQLDLESYDTVLRNRKLEPQENSGT